jgi:PAS domain S-box-containing protein
VLTGQDFDLAHYYEINGASRISLARLADLVRGNPEQAAAAVRLTEAEARRRLRFDSVLAVRRAAGLEPARRMTLERVGQRMTDELIRSLETMGAREDSLLATRRAAWDRSAVHTQRIQLGAMLLVIALVVGSYLLLMRAAAQRRKALEERDRAFEMSLDMLCTADAAGRFVTLNPAWEKTLGYPLAELIGKPFIELVHPDDRDRTLEQYRLQMEAGARALNFVNRYRHRDGTYLVFSWTAVPDLAAGVTYAAARDITELEQAHERQRRDAERLAAALEEASALNRELEAFSYSVSHDLRAPLRHIDGFSGLLERELGSSLSEKARKHLATIRGAVTRMSQLIDGLLLFSRLGRAEMRSEPVRLDDLAKGVLHEVEEEVKQRRISVELRPLPVVKGDATLLGTVLRNLVGNAIKYSRGKESPLITIGSDHARDGLAVMFVRDNGAGFDMKYSAKLFGVFQRLHSAEEFDGAGVGLATVQRIVHRHGGKVWAEGAVGEGAAFYVALPPADPARQGG